MTPAAEHKAGLIERALSGPVAISTRQIAGILAMLTSVQADEREEGKREVRRLVQGRREIEAREARSAVAIAAGEAANRFEP